MSRGKYDWDRIEVEYRANKLSNRELSKKFGPSESAIRHRAKKEGWQRDLAKEVQSRTKEKLIRDGSLAPDLNDEEVVEEIASRNANVVETHRRDIVQARSISGMLMGELYDSTKDRVLLQDVVDGIAQDDEWDAQRRNIVERAISLPQRAAVMRDLANSMKTLQGLERTAHGIDGKEDDRDALDELLEAVSDTSRGVEGY